MSQTPYKLALIGDPHLAVPREADDPLLEIDPGRKLHGLSVELLTSVVNAVNAEPQVSAAVILGDLTRDSEDFNHSACRDVLRGLRMPYYLVVGNHDLGLTRGGAVDKIYPGVHRLGRDEVCAFYRDEGFPAGRSYYSVVLHPGLRLIVLDSSIAPEQRDQCKLPDLGPDDGWLELEQFDWLDQELDAADAERQLPLVVLHHSILDQSPAERPGHPLMRTFQFWQLRNSAELNSLLQAHGVPLVLSGHLHAQCINREHGLTNLVTSATVSYPHAWRLLSFGPESIGIESRRVEHLPSCENLQEKSRQWMAEGMTGLIQQKLREIGGMKGIIEPLGEMVTRSEWWPRFSEGSLRGFKVDPAIIPKADFVHNLLIQQIVKVLNGYGAWQDVRPDPGELSIPLNNDQRRRLLDPKG